MPEYKLKLKANVENFEVVDGPFAGRRFKRGKIYTTVPNNEKHKFEEVKPAKPIEKPSPKPQTEKKKAAGDNKS